MDSQFALASRDDLWQLQNEMKSVYATQSDHSERLARLERRQEDDSRMKSVWGTSSPFPSILGGTPQQDPGYNPAAEAFKNFDQDQSNNLLGSLHLDTEDEPRRGASRANSVRFDESALHGHFGHGSRSSSDFFPMRTGSGLGGHPMTERSSSHKSEGRQSAASLSNPISRLNSLAFEGRHTPHTPVTPIGPPPGLFHLGPLPSIIRCWLNTNFSNDTLLYAAICTGSYRSVLARSMVQSLGLGAQVTNANGEAKIKIQVFLAEATIQQASSRSDNPAPQLPTMTIEFLVQDMPEKDASIKIFLGSDILRTRNGDVLFSQDRLTIFDDDRNKLAVPLVRPENSEIFHNLITISSVPISTSGGSSTDTTAYPFSVVTNGLGGNNTASFDAGAARLQPVDQVILNANQLSSAVYSPTVASTKQPSVIGDGRSSLITQGNGRSESPAQSESHTNDYDSIADGATPDTPTKGEISSTWGSWRRDSAQSARPDSTFSSIASNTGYQRPSRGRGMKVLKPARSTAPSRSTSVAQASTGPDAAIARSSENGGRVNQHTAGESSEHQRPGPPARTISNEAKSPLHPLANKPRSANPVGGASAFGWLNAAQQKQPSAPE
ncbi:hypothetical protein MMC26_001616 [Xylographa opegraphella]|nr:hypothetical protein [Xylographa opegraphella]